MSLHADITAYLAERAASDWSARSVDHHRYILRRLDAAMTTRGHRRWATVSGSDLDAWMQSLMVHGLGRASRDAFAYSVRGFFSWLTTHGKILCNPAEDIAVCDDDELDLPPAPLSEEQVATFFDQIPRDHVVHLRNRLHSELLYSCGLRGAEAVALDVRDLDLNARTVLVRHGKGDRARMLPLLASTLAAAADYLALRRELLRGPDHGALLIATNGRRLPLWFMQRWLAAISGTLGFRLYPHLLRHSIAVHLLRRGADIRYIQQFLGHADLETTKIYLRLVPGHLREDYDKAMPVLMGE